MTNDNNTKYVTYRWLITTVVASVSSMLLLTGAIANTTFYHKSDGTHVEARVGAIEHSLDRIESKLDRLIERKD